MSSPFFTSQTDALEIFTVTDFYNTVQNSVTGRSWSSDQFDNATKPLLGNALRARSASSGARGALFSPMSNDTNILAPWPARFGLSRCLLVFEDVAAGGG